MKISVIPLAAGADKEVKIKSFISRTLSDNTSFEIIETIPEKGLAGDKIFLFAIVTGGTESKFREIFQRFSPPYILIFNEYNNSLPAAIEILSFLRKNGKDAELIDLKDLSDEFLRKRFPLAGKTIGTIGKPSDWLIASTYSDETFEKTFKIKVKHIDIKESFEEFEKADAAEAENLAEDFAKNAGKLIGRDIGDIARAFKFYIALKEIIKRHSLDIISVRCFDIIKPLNTTGCIALSKLNSEGITASCEGDLPAAISMEVAKIVSGKPGFMANVSYLSDHESGVKVNFAHCTVPVSLVSAYALRTHFETGKGVGIEGKIGEGDVTVLRIGGKELKEASVATGYAVKTEFSNNRCRTQLDVEFDKKVKEYFLKNPLGNHHIIIKGDYKEELSEFLTNAGIKVII